MDVTGAPCDHQNATTNGEIAGTSSHVKDAERWLRENGSEWASIARLAGS